jgi:hypothetical protein
MTIKKPEPYCWAVQSQTVCLVWHGDNAELLAREASRSSNVSQPFPLYKEPPVTEESSAAQQEPPPIKWMLDAEEESSYNNFVGITPFGKILITWKGWKANPTASVDIFPGGFFMSGSPEEVKAACEAEYVRRFSGIFCLTEGEITNLIKETWGCASIAPQKAHSFACAIEAKLKEKNQ